LPRLIAGWSAAFFSHDVPRRSARD